MKTALKRSLALVLVLALAAVLLLPAAAVSMPAGYTEAQVEASIPKAEALVGALLKSGDIPDPKQTVYDLLFSDGTLNAVFSGVCGAFAENESTLTALGLDLSVSSVADALAAFPSVTAVLNGRTDWNAALQAAPYLQWNVRSKDSFGAALAGILSPLNPLLFTLLCSGAYQVSPLISVTGADGYQNAVVPLLRSLGCPAIMSQADYTAAAADNRFSMVRNLTNMLFAAVDNILAAPVTSLCAYLPGIAYYLESGGLTGTLQTLMEPLTLKVAVFSLPGVSRLMENTELFSSGVDLKAMLEKADLSAFTGGQANMKLPEIDLAALAACGGMADGTFAPNRAQAFVVIMTWLLDAVKMNRSVLPAAAQGLSSFLDKSSAELLGLLLKLLNLNAAPRTQTPAWTAPAFTPGTVEYTPNLTRDNYVRVLEMIDDTLNEFLLEFTDKGSLSDVLRKNIYSNRLVSELTKGVYAALYTEETAPMLSMLGIAASPAGVGAAVRGTYPAAARTLSSYTSWERVDPARVGWGFSDGSRAGFVAAVTAVLRPFAPLLRFLLAEGSFSLMDALTLGGSNGYETAVVPLLEGIGCAPETVVSYAEYKRSSDTGLITNILQPVTALLDGVCEKPVDTVCGLLPQIAWFLRSDQPKQCMEHLLYPVTQLLSELGLQSLLPADLTAAADLDPASLLSGLTKNAGLDLTLPAPDLGKVAGLGTLQTGHSKRAVGAQYTYVEADKPAVLVTALRYVLGAVKNGDGDLLSSFSMGGGDAAAEGGMDMMAMYTEKTVEKLKSMSVDETIEWLYDLLFAETPTRENAADDGFIPTVIYEAEPDHTVRNRALIGGGAVVLLTGLVCFLVKFDFHKASERRQRRKKQRQAEKRAAAGAVKTEKRAAADAVKAEKRAVAEAVKADKRAVAEAVKADKRAVAAAKRNGRALSAAQPAKRVPAPPLTEQEIRRAYRETKKADRHYGRSGRN